jgi:hypothetical protein
VSETLGDTALHLKDLDIVFSLYVVLSFVYKLTDFGAARELAPEQEFMSIYGTEEYLVGSLICAYFFIKGQWQQKNVLSHSKERLKLSLN